MPGFDSAGCSSGGVTLGYLGDSGIPELSFEDGEPRMRRSVRTVFACCFLYARKEDVRLWLLCLLNINRRGVVDLMRSTPAAVVTNSLCGFLRRSLLVRKSFVRFALAGLTHAYCRCLTQVVVRSHKPSTALAPARLLHFSVYGQFTGNASCRC